MPRIRLLGAAAAAALAIGACQGATSTPSPTTAAVLPSESAGAAPSGSAEASPSGSGEVLGGNATPAPSLNQVVVQFKAVGGSNITGGAFLTETGGGKQTAVSIGVVAIGVEDPMPAGIYEGSCPDVTGEPQYKLGDLTTGASNTVVDASIDTLTSTPHAIAIHDPKSPDKVVSCGDITQ